MPDWRIYYGDNTTYDSNDGKPESAPNDNVQFLVFDDEPGTYDCGRIILQQWDFYLYSDHIGGWHGVNSFHDLVRHLKVGLGPGGVRVILEGWWIKPKDFRRIKKTAVHDTDFRPKSAQDPQIERGAIEGNEESNPPK